MAAVYINIIEKDTVKIGHNVTAAVTIDYVVREVGTVLM